MHLDFWSIDIPLITHERRPVREPLPAEVAAVALLAGVGDGVRLQVGPRLEPGAARAALEGARAAVHHLDVAGQGVLVLRRKEWRKSGWASVENYNTKLIAPTVVGNSSFQLFSVTDEYFPNKVLSSSRISV